MAVASSVARGRHLCGVAFTAESHGRMVASWVAAGLAARMHTVWVGRSAGFAADWLEHEGVAWDAAVHDGRLLICEPEAILGLNGDADVADRLAAAIDLSRRALADGYAGLCIGVDCADALNAVPDASAQLAFEVAWEQLTRRHPLSLMCLYSPEVERDHVKKAVATHPREYSDPLADARLVDGRICIGGEVDLSNSDLLREFLEAAVAAPELTGLDPTVVDLAELSFIDLGGVRQVVELARAGAPRRLRVDRAPDLFWRMVEMAGWTQRLDLPDGTS